ncbi:phospholipase effector Tle1 domain-containing protein [Serratia sp. L9]|uniref:phospholipase effector Tle1 domain-containing protein n=1 Tax=Serratia sp. L9 TaxID=3423946 RepID=UPI003D677793
MRARWPLSGVIQRREAITSLLEPLRAKVATTQPHLLGIKLFIYGFSRGAAEARTFVNWLTELFETPAGALDPQPILLGLPLTVEFLGLLDTVPSVGVAHIAPFAAGHMGWADGTQQLPDEERFPSLIKCCRHLISAHEQRLCFTLDSIRRPSGVYPANSKEIIYPGMHSDVGGGILRGIRAKHKRLKCCYRKYPYMISMPLRLLLALHCLHPKNLFQKTY